MTTLMFEKSDQQFANADQHTAVRRHLLASLQDRRKHCWLSIFVLSGSSVVQLLLLLFMARSSTSSSWDVIGLLGLALLFTLAGAVSEIGRFYPLDTQIKVIRMMEVANGQAEAESLLESFNP